MIRRHCPIRKVSPDDGWHYWFGYYDKCPWSADGTKLLAHRARFCDRFPAPDEPAEVGWIDAERGSFEAIGLAHAWNWQQGAQLQWIIDAGHERVLYNDIADNRPVARIVEPSGAEVRIVPWPVYAVSPDARNAATLDFGRLTRLRREYGLPAVHDANPRDPAPETDGVWRLDLRTGERTLLASIAAVRDHRHNPMGDRAHHYVNHLMFNRSGSRLCFLHRFDRQDGILRSRLFTVGTDGSGLRLLMEGMVSHYDWRDDSTLLAWAGRRALLGGGTRGPRGAAMNAARRTLKPVYYALGKPRFLMSRIVRDSYLLIPDEEIATTQPFARAELTCDGHCTFNRGGPEPGRWVVTDGYPDLRSRQPLFLWDCRHNTGYEIGRYPTPRELDGETRADLHPRFNHDATLVCIDSAMDGRRGMYVVDCGELVGIGGS